MTPYQHRDIGRKRAGNNRSRLSLALTGLLLLSGCGGLQEWFPGWVGDGKSATGPVDTSSGEHWHSQVRTIQADLTELGYDPGPVDGMAGPATEQAIKAYQEDAGLEADGRITRQLTKHLAAAVGREVTQEPKAGSDIGAVQVDNAGLPPEYDAGDTYIWSNGRVETVVRAAGNKLFWQTNDGVRFTADRNFLIPPSSWTGPRGTGEADALLEAPAPWPLTEDSPLIFTVDESGGLAGWLCEAVGTERVSVPAGHFNAVVLACERDPAPPGEWVRRIWFYAPAVRHYVARTDTMADGSQISEKLVGIRPGAEDWPPAVRAGLRRAIQDALRDLAAGKKSLWTSTVVEEEFEIRPGPVRKTPDGRCRVFKLTARGTQNARAYPALACTVGNSGRWKIPGDAVGGSSAKVLPIDAG